MPSGGGAVLVKIDQLLVGLYMAVLGTLFVFVTPVMLRRQRDPNYPNRLVHRLTAVGSDQALNRTIRILQAMAVVFIVVGVAVAISAL